MGSISVSCDCGYVYNVSQGSALICPKCGRVPILLWDGNMWTHKLEEFNYQSPTWAVNKNLNISFDDGCKLEPKQRVECNQNQKSLYIPAYPTA
jgi:hypothetical protein